MVVSAHRLASEAGERILRHGGNAVDAAVATGFALAVVYPEAGNIGGGGFMVIKMNDGRETVIDYREKAPAHSAVSLFLDSAGTVSDRTTNGHLASGVPGAVDGLLTALREFGTMKPAEVLAPAIELAERGFAVDDRLAGSLTEYKDELLRYPSTVALVTVSGALYREGDTLRQPELAATLGRIAHKGRDGFYSGETANDIVEEMKEGGGIITLEDLASYRAVVRTPLHGTYRGYDVVTASLPSSGGLCLIEMLNLAERFELSSMGFHSFGSVHVMAEAMKRVFADRAEFMGDPDVVQVPVARLASKMYAEYRAAEIDMASATPAPYVEHGDVPVLEGSNTTHYSVVDSFGNCVAATTTLNDLFGSKVVVGKAGFFLNDEMDDFSIKPGVPNMYGLIGSRANSLRPGKRMLSSMAPTILLKEGKPVFILGARGGSRIITTVFEAIVNVVDYGMRGQEAIDQPRFHHQWLPDELIYEKFCFPREQADLLTRIGYCMEEREYATGSANGIFIDPVTGIRFSAIDPREGGWAAGF